MIVCACSLVCAGIGLRKSEIEQILDEVGMNADGEVGGQMAVSSRCFVPTLCLHLMDGPASADSGQDGEGHKI